jgi:hypothetical protein
MPGIDGLPGVVSRVTPSLSAKAGEEGACFVGIGCVCCGPATATAQLLLGLMTQAAVVIQALHKVLEPCRQPEEISNESLTDSVNLIFEE